jgi:hypothetical protein
MVRPILVDSVDAEDRALGACACGGSWTLASEDVAPIGGRWFDALVVRCGRCGEHSRAVFDVTTFFEPPTHAWARVTS